MALWDYNAYWQYDAAGNIIGAVSPASQGNTQMSDGQADTQFTTADSIVTNSITFGATAGTFIGTIQLGTFPGVTWVGIEFADGRTAYFAQLDPATTAGQINDAWRAEFGNPHTAATAEAALSNTTGFTTCFAAGTLIATPEGERAVETLQIGDLIRTGDGRAAPVKWIGRQTVSKVFTPAERFVPVRVKAGALGHGLPHTDLVLTADHALILDGFAVNAGALVNGTTIAFDPIDSLPDRVTYYHVETEAHDVILANGAAAETYVDYRQRAAFDNHAEYLALYGEERTIAEMPLPRISAARMLPPAIRQKIAANEAA